MHMIGIIMDRTEGALQRVLGLIERRGFIVEGVDMRSGTGALAHVTVDVSARDSGRSLEVLIRQIARLVDVQRVSAACGDTARHPAETPFSMENSSVSAGAVS